MKLFLRLGVVFFMSKIEDIKARMILDSRGNPTVETDVFLDNIMGRAAVPSGASTGTYEAVELRDGDSAFHGKGVGSAIANVNSEIRAQLLGQDVSEQSKIDNLLCSLDGTDRKSRLGANAILSCSMAIAVAAAKAQNIPLYKHIGKLTDHDANILPVPSMNVINGGAHAGNKLDIQEHMILPIGAASFKDSVRMCSEVYFQLKTILKKSYGSSSINVGDEGGFAPPFNVPIEPLEFIIKAIEEVGYTDKIKLGLDCAASEFYDTDNKVYELDSKKYTNSELIDFYLELASKYPIISIEDPLAEDDWDGFVEITDKLGGKLQIIGDDLFVTNMDRLKHGIEMNACNCLLLKLNQIGSVTESFSAAKMAFDNNYSVMVSHRSGETEDNFIADLVVGICSGQIKSGAPARSDRTAKYNQLLRIEEELGSSAKYAGKDFRNVAK
jgi:enolase